MILSSQTLTSTSVHTSAPVSTVAQKVSTSIIPQDPWCATLESQSHVPLTDNLRMIVPIGIVAGMLGAAAIMTCAWFVRRWRRRVREKKNDYESATPAVLLVEGTFPSSVSGGMRKTSITPQPHTGHPEHSEQNVADGHIDEQVDVPPSGMHRNTQPSRPPSYTETAQSAPPPPSPPYSTQSCTRVQTSDIALAYFPGSTSTQSVPRDDIDDRASATPAASKAGGLRDSDQQGLNINLS
ncbi:hypothetical protein WOLCODRAFT_21359 [Wolfiporia cocos MD-104 SS10]|uniref:Uncharacterized protein n=1 Tax=Wolfiporia cocos (strain MD-104) TaxID=742152 RepID=A0A2H3JSW2_WOLCO|nr:hypothetical protein WOLCODRAFT_21359 [Wolfiporia cocos MD-104 SS10]